MYRRAGGGPGGCVIVWFADRNGGENSGVVFWAVIGKSSCRRNGRGTRYATKLNIPALKTSPTPYAYAITRCNGKQLNIAIYYGYPHTHLGTCKRYIRSRLYVDVPIPPQVKGHTLFMARANARTISMAAPVQIHGNRINMEVPVPS